MLEDRLREMNIQLPKLAGPVGAYVSAKRAGNLIFVSGQLPMQAGQLIAAGAVPSQCSVEQAQQGARQCVINALAAVAALEGSVNAIGGVLRVGAFVCSDNGFTQQPQIANAASQLLIELLGENGRHARAAVGTNVLPLSAAVEIEFVFIAA